MSIILSKESLFRSLEIVERALSADSPIPALKNILMESDSRQLILSSTNLELEAKVILPYEGDEPGSVLIPGRITDIVRLLPAPEVQLDLNPDNLHIAVNSGRSSYNLFGTDPAEFPRIEEVSPAGNEAITLKASVLREILRMVVFAASTEETRPAFNGVLFEFEGDRWSMTSSDTYRLVFKSTRKQGWQFQPSRSLVPAKALRELLKVLEPGDEEVTFFPGKDKLIFKFSSVYFAARMLNEKYPDISSVIPERYSTRVVVDRHELIDSVSRATLLAEGANNAIHLAVADNSLTVQVTSQIGRMEEPVDVKKEGEEIDLYINSRFVMDILKAASSKEMVVDFHGKSGPVVFRLPDDENYLYLVLPIKMN
jgi:DNA polymerase-3 subunit beta